MPRLQGFTACGTGVGVTLSFRLADNPSGVQRADTEPFDRPSFGRDLTDAIRHRVIAFPSVGTARNFEKGAVS